MTTSATPRGTGTDLTDGGLAEDVSDSTDIDGEDADDDDEDLDEDDGSAA